jgi:hypothetical protein
MTTASSRITFALSDDFALFQSICAVQPDGCCSIRHGRASTIVALSAETVCNNDGQAIKIVLIPVLRAARFQELSEPPMW